MGGGGLCRPVLVCSWLKLDSTASRPASGKSVVWRGLCRPVGSGFRLALSGPVVSRPSRRLFACYRLYKLTNVVRITSLSLVVESHNDFVAPIG